MQVSKKYYVMYSALLFAKECIGFGVQVLSPNISVRLCISVLKKVMCAPQKRRPQLFKAPETEASGGNRLDEIITPLTPRQAVTPAASLSLSLSCVVLRNVF